ncbi:hypothetical protein OG601_44450 [Streptomyces sp. NBC_01239]|nr:hypothetical protein [Streptomyces sp. NBC_01239]MCX4817650.1 hypothetical protein [Streptomyces sp. NBC_01239]
MLDATTSRAAAAVQGGLLLTQGRRDTVALEASLDTLIDCLRGHAER